MKWPFFAIIIVLLVTLGVGLAFYFQKPATDEPEGDSPFSVFDPFSPSRPGSGGTVTPGQPEVIENEATKKVSEEVEKTEQPLRAAVGQYYEVGASAHATSSAYTVLYVDADKSIQVILHEQPIGKSRRLAEEFLLSTLHLTKGEACTLNYQVVTPDYVDQTYGGQNLGFSFCSGSVVLSEI